MPDGSLNAFPSRWAKMRSAYRSTAPDASVFQGRWARIGRKVVVWVSGVAVGGMPGEAFPSAGITRTISPMVDAGFVVWSGTFTNSLYALDAPSSPIDGALAEADAAGCDTSRVWLIGGSMGGGAVVEWAGRHPGRVGGVLAICPLVDLVAAYARFKVGTEPGMSDLAFQMRSTFGPDDAGMPGRMASLSAAAHPEAFATLRDRIQVCWSTNDAYIPEAEVRPFVEASGVHGFSQGAAGHSGAGVTPSDIATWLRGEPIASVVPGAG